MDESEESVLWWLRLDPPPVVSYPVSSLALWYLMTRLCQSSCVAGFSGTNNTSVSGGINVKVRVGGGSGLKTVKAEDAPTMPTLLC